MAEKYLCDKCGREKPPQWFSDLFKNQEPPPVSSLLYLAKHLVDCIEKHGEHLTDDQVSSLLRQLEEMDYEVWDSDPDSVTPVDEWRVYDEARIDREDWEYERHLDNQRR